MAMLSRTSPEHGSGMQTGRNTPDLGFFDSDNFHLLQLTQDRKEERLRRERVKARQERLSRGPLLESIWTSDLGHYSQLYRADGNPKPKRIPAKPQTFFGLRRPLNATEQRVVAAMPGYEKDHREWADKPYSTVYTGRDGYKDVFPLLMQMISESENKDVTLIQTETRRMSLVTTDYSKGTIKLAGSKEEIKYAVFPMLHRVIESEDEDEDDDEDDEESISHEDDKGEEHRAPKNRPPPLLPQDVLDRLEAIAAQRDESGDDDDDGSEESECAEPPPGWLEHRSTRMHATRRLSITTRPSAENPRMLKRRSVDYDSLFYNQHEVDEHEKMDSITEDGEDESQAKTDDDDGELDLKTAAVFSSGAPAGTWAMAADAKERQSRSARERDLANILRQAEQKMEHMDENLQKLEDFLNNFEDDSHTDVKLILK